MNIARTRDFRPEVVEFLVLGRHVGGPGEPLFGQGSLKVSSFPKLGPDERAVLELFVSGRTKMIAARFDPAAPEGYSFDAAGELGWGARRLQRALESLESSGALKSEVSDSVVACKSCRSSTLRLRMACPACRSIDVQRHAVLEHFACGLVEKQEAFRQGEKLVCPKCKRKLELVGSDYRNLSYMYACRECGALSADLLETMICGVCGAEAPVEEEEHLSLFAYSLLGEAKEAFVQIKPVQRCVEWFRGMGLEVEFPGFFEGRSGVNHVFDLKVKGQGERGVAVAVLLSDKPLEPPEVAGVCGMAADLGVECYIYAVPGLTDDARRMTAAFNIKVIDEEALRGTPPQAMEPDELVQSVKG